MQLIKGSFSYRVGKELDLKMEIWERGYVNHRIRDLTDFINHAEYIRMNPVEAGLVSGPAGYPYCSGHAGQFGPFHPGAKTRLVVGRLTAELKLCPPVNKHQT